MVEKFKVNAKRVFSNGPKAKIVLFLIVASMLILTIYNMKKTVIVRIDGEEQSILTYAGTVKGALQGSNISLSSKDKVEPGLDTMLNDNEVITVKKAVPVEVTVDGKDQKIETAESNINDMLAAENIQLGDDDKLSVDADTPITEGLKFKIIRVQTKDVVETKTLDFDTIVKNDDNMDKGFTKTVQEGTPGEKEVTVRVSYEDGVEVSRKTVSEKVTKEPTNKIVSEGTRNFIALSRGGDTKLYYQKVMSVKASAYTGGGTTATGTTPRRNPSGISTIAVDPRIVPLGSKVYVEGYGYAIAEDTGGAIKNNKIDIYMNSNRECYSWGVRSVNLYVVAYPGQW
ncbi:MULTISPECIES: G5 and 3D domain-containing protein [Clostridium]|uniref:G5 domain-containing protein n=1 Tax=Clostridium paridis TaxID=2803863 RepID=A0A937FCM4_9CLOT|nr:MULTISPECIES: G5 and 3D domain-containing protein [Clostridium]MBL4931434.1 G5 domain-containing protein [Clostridium paridis]